MGILLAAVLIAAPIDDRLPSGSVSSGGVISAGSLHLEDDILLSFGNTPALPDSWFVQNSGSTRFELRNQTGLVWSVDEGTDDVDFSGGIVVAGQINAEDNIVLANSKYIAGNTGAGLLARNTNQTNNQAAGLMTATAVNILLLHEFADRGFDFAHAAQTNPTLFIHSANQATDEWISFTHNQTNGVVEVGTGNITLDAALNIHGSNGKGAAVVIDAATPTTVTFAANPGDASKTATGFRVAQKDILGISGRVVVAGTNCASFDVGDGSDQDRYGSNIAVAAGTVFDSSDWTASATEFLTAAGDIVLTGKDGGAGAADCYDLSVKLVIHTREITAATID